MSTKMKLSDDLLEGVAGGILTFGGEEVNKAKASVDSLTFTTVSGKEYTMPWNDALVAKFRKSPLGTLEVTNQLFKEMLDGNRHELEEYLKM